MRILLSAFSCGPGQGSEPGIGWNYALEAVRAGHSVTVVTQTEFQREIEAVVADGSLPPNIRFHFFMPRWLGRFRDAGLKLGLAGPTWQLTHLLWQIVLPRHLTSWIGGQSFDIVHHITFGGIRHVTRLGRLGLPLVLGPLGGGDSVPKPLRRSFPLVGRIAERFRDLHNFLTRFDPITRRAVADALVVYAKTPGSKAALPEKHQGKIVVLTEVGAAPRRGPEPAAAAMTDAIHLMFAGKFLDFKGMHLGIAAIAEASRQGVPVRLTMVGSGPEEARLKRLADALGVGHLIAWRGRVRHDEMAEIYRTHHALLFPSLREGSGNVVLEAFTQGLPVIAFDNSGPAVVGRPDCTLFIPARGRSEGDAISDIAAAIRRLHDDASLRVEMRTAALRRSRELEWPLVVGRFYRDVETRLSEAAASPRPTAAATGRPT